MTVQEREKLNALGEEWGRCGPGDDARRQALQNDVFMQIYPLLTEARREVIGMFFEKDWPGFDPQKGSLSAFLFKRLEDRCKDREYEDRGWWRPTVEDPQTGEKRRAWKNPYVNNEAGAEDGAPLLECLPDRAAGDLEAGLRMDDIACEMLVLMLNLPQRLEGRANNPIRRKYFRLFFTDNVVNILHTRSAPEGFLRRERDLFGAMSEGFLDYFMRRCCRTVQKIIDTGLKPYGELVEGRPMDKEPDQPLPVDVYIAYLDQEEHYRAGSSAVSQQRTAYQAFLAQLIAN